MIELTEIFCGVDWSFEEHPILVNRRYIASAWPARYDPYTHYPGQVYRIQLSTGSCHWVTSAFIGPDPQLWADALSGDD